MLSRFPQWSQRLIDVAVVIVVLILASRVWPKFPLGVGAYVSALLIWSAGLSGMGHYKTGATPALAGVAGKLLIDHAMLCAVWFGALFLLGVKPGVTFVAIFGAVSFAGLAAARLRTIRGPRIKPVSGSLLFADSLIGLATLYAVNGLWWSLAFPFSLVVGVVLGRALTQIVSSFIARPLPAWLAGQGIFIAWLAVARPALQWPQTSWQLVLGGGLLPALLIGAHRWALRRNPPADAQETWRRVILFGGVFALLHPLFSAQLMGAADAQLYAEAMQDFLGQLKAGIFPVFVSQTDIAPWGSVFPFRMAFYHFHFGALLDLLTLHSLNVYAVQHLTLVLSGAGGAVALYVVLKRLAPERPWESLALALLYLGGPTWLSVFYGLDMYFTAMTLPWLPLLVFGIVRTFESDCGWRIYLLLGAALAATWLAHPPVGFWAAVLVLVSQLVRLASAGHAPTRRDFGGLILAVGTCLLLCAGLFVSLTDVRITGELVDPTDQVLRNLRSVIPQIFLPVSPAAERLGDLQLGYAWELLLLAGFLFRPRPTPRAHWVLLALTAGLLVLIFPLPVITPAAWRALPWQVTNITNVWPMQRLYPLVATLIAFIAIGAMRTGVLARGATWRLSVLCALGIWTGFEAAKFIRRGHAYTRPAEATRVLSKVENSPLLASWTAYTPQLPAQTLIGSVNDPRLRNRLLDLKTKAELVSNERLATGAIDRVPANATPINATKLTGGVFQLSPSFTLEPGVRYQLTFYFGDANYAGVLQLLPLHDIHDRFYREIALVAKPTSPLTLTVWTTEPAPLTVDLLFRPTDPAYAEQARPAFFQRQIQSYRASDLPIKVTSLAPYVANVETAQPAFLETHRFFARGYRATVNHQTVPVTESPDHLAMLPLGAGKNDVRLDYVGPPAVRLAFWVSAFSWIALAGFTGSLVLQRWLARFRPAVQSTSPSIPAA